MNKSKSFHERLQEYSTLDYLASEENGDEEAAQQALQSLIDEHDALQAKLAILAKAIISAHRIPSAYGMGHCQHCGASGQLYGAIHHNLDCPVLVAADVIDPST